MGAVEERKGAEGTVSDLVEERRKDACACGVKPSVESGKSAVECPMRHDAKLCKFITTSRNNSP